MRVYVINEDEMAELINNLALEKMIATNHFGGYADIKRLYPQDFDKLKGPIDSIHRGFHMVAYNWAMKMGFEDIFKKVKHYG